MRYRGLISKTARLFVLVWIVYAAHAYAASWQQLNQQVIGLSQQKKYTEALPVARDALDIAEKEFGPNAPEVALSLNNLGFLYKTQGQFNKAIPLYERSVMIGEKVAGTRHEDLLVLLNNLAALYEAAGQKEKADGIYRKIRNNGYPEVADKLEKQSTAIRH